MSDYRAPLTDMQFVLNHVARLDQVLGLDPYEGIDGELVSAILDESGTVYIRGSRSTE